MLLAVIAVLATAPAAAQTAASNVGLAGIGAAGLHVGPVRVERAAEGYEVGALLDLGWLGSHALRVQGEIAFVAARLTEFVETENRTFHGKFYDLTTSVSLVLQSGNERSRAVGYVAAGLGVHALSSAFGEVSIDQRYNANPFGSHIGAGARVWVPGARRHGLFVEFRRTIAEHVNRTAVRFGGLMFFNDLVR